MTTTITLDLVKSRLRNYLEENETYESFRSFVYSRYESEDDVVVEEAADDLFSVVAPFMETEAALPDSNRKVRLQRLDSVLCSENQRHLTTAAVFAINYDELQELERKRLAGVLPQRVFGEQVGKVSPAKYDVSLIESWLRKHSQEPEPNVAKM